MVNYELIIVSHVISLSYQIHLLQIGLKHKLILTDNCMTNDTSVDLFSRFNEAFDLPLPYNALYDYNGICFVLSSTYTDKKGMHEQLIAGANMKLYNSKK